MTARKRKTRTLPPCTGCATTDYRLDGMQISSYSHDLSTGALTCWRCLKALKAVTA